MKTGIPIPPTGVGTKYMRLEGGVNGNRRVGIQRSLGQGYRQGIDEMRTEGISSRIRRLLAVRSFLTI